MERSRTAGRRGAVFFLVSIDKQGELKLKERLDVLRRRILRLLVPSFLPGPASHL